MLKNKVRVLILGCLVIVMMLLAGCSLGKATKGPLDPKKPVSIILWNYYNGQTKEKFDELISQFNDTVGMEMGIVVDAFSQGDVQQLANAVFDAANNKIGSPAMPHLFAAYPDNAYRVDQLIGLADIETYFTNEELEEFQQEFLEEGRFGEGDKLKIIPIAKSSENLFLNKTDWDAFASETGADIKGFATWEGISEIAKEYYEWTDKKTPEANDGKALLGIDSPANYMLITSMQLGQDIYSFEKGEMKFSFDEDQARKIWENFYLPYLKGYYAKTGRFCSDDAKIGTVIAYIGSTAGAAYFPTEVSLSQTDVYPIVCAALPYPSFKGGESYVIQQGAGMCISKSDEAHEYAAAVFLKWFTDSQQNIEFAVSTGYFPVKTAALNAEKILSARRNVDGDTANTATTESIKTTVEMLSNYTFYGNKPFEGSYDMRQLLETSMFAQVQKDLKILEESMQKGKDREQVVKQLVSEENFKQWHKLFMREAALILE